MTYPLTLGNVAFSLLEIPQKIGPFGGKQVLVVHEYPGGAREVDDIGAFPVPISWTGIFTGRAAFARAYTVDRMRATGLEVVLQYGPQAYLGKVGRFEFNPAHQFFIPYTLHFEPILDLTGVGTVVFGGISAESALFGALAAVAGIVGGSDGLALPGSLTDPTNAMTDSVSAGLLNGNGTVAGIPTANGLLIAATTAAVQVAALSLITGPDPVLASPALDLSTRATSIGILVASPTRATRQFQAINPNLFALAAQYYAGNTDRWTDIAAASGLSDPMPTGEFTITVPAV